MARAKPRRGQQLQPQQPVGEGEGLAAAAAAVGPPTLAEAGALLEAGVALPCEETLFEELQRWGLLPLAQLFEVVKEVGRTNTADSSRNTLLLAGVPSTVAGSQASVPASSWEWVCVEWVCVE